MLLLMTWPLLCRGSLSARRWAQAARFGRAWSNPTWPEMHWTRTLKPCGRHLPTA